MPPRFPTPKLAQRCTTCVLLFTSLACRNGPAASDDQALRAAASAASAASATPAAAASLAPASSGSVPAQARLPGWPPLPALSPETQREVVARLAHELTDKYIFPDVGAKMASQLKGAATTAIAAPRDPYEFAKSLTNELQTISNDKHLRVVVESAEAAPALDQAFLVEMQQRGVEAAGKNVGFRHVEILPGNVGYLDIAGWWPPQFAREQVRAAMALLAKSEALIIDMRDNHGGDSDGVMQMLSFFLPAKLHTFDFVGRPDKAIPKEEVWTLDEIPGERRLDTPLYVLTSAETFSGGEHFAYELSTRKRATLVGETTGGGANPANHVALSAGLAVFLPDMRPVFALTGSNWEGTGVQPNVACPAADALDTALKLAKQVVAAEREKRALALEPKLRELAALLQRAHETNGALQQQARQELLAKLRQGQSDGWLSARMLANIGFTATAAGRHTLAIDILELHLKGDPQSPQALAELAEAHTAADQRARAAALYRQALRINPRYGRASTGLAALTQKPETSQPDSKQR